MCLIVSKNAKIRPIGDTQYIGGKFKNKPCKVEEGLHTFVSFEDAICRMCDLDFVNYQNGLYVVAICKIPVGARYVEGRSPGGTLEYVSDRLVVEKIF